MDCPVCPTRDIPPGQSTCPGCGVDLTPLWRIREVKEGISIVVPGVAWTRRPGVLLAVALILVAVPFSLGLLLGKSQAPLTGSLAPGDVLDAEASVTPGVRNAPPEPADTGRGESAGDPIAGPSDAAISAELEVVRTAFSALPVVTPTLAGNRVRVVFREGIFPSGADVPLPAGRRTLESVATLLTGLARSSEGESAGMTVEVVGHSDDVPPQPGSEWRDNWSLSFDRAHSAVEILRAQDEADLITWLATASAEKDAPFGNDTEGGRSRNRTVVLLVAPQGDRK